MKLFNRFSKSKSKSSSSNKQRKDNLENLLKTDDDEDEEEEEKEEEKKDRISFKKLLFKGNDNRLSLDNYTCTCCFEILYNPISLLCGHNFCQICLANWYLISSNRVCPLCRQEWMGAPKLNIVLQ